MLIRDDEITLSAERKVEVEPSQQRHKDMSGTLGLRGSVICKQLAYLMDVVVECPPSLLIPDKGSPGIEEKRRHYTSPRVYLCGVVKDGKDDSPTTQSPVWSPVSFQCLGAEFVYVGSRREVPPTTTKKPTVDSGVVGYGFVV